MDGGTPETWTRLLSPVREGSLKETNPWIPYLLGLSYCQVSVDDDA